MRWILEWERDFSDFFVALSLVSFRKGLGEDWREMRETYRHAKFLGQSVHFCMFEQLRSAFICLGRRRIGFELAGGEFVGEVFACIQVFQEARRRVQIFFVELHAVLGR